MWDTTLIDITRVRLQDLERDLTRRRLVEDARRAAKPRQPSAAASLRRALAGRLAAFAVTLHAEAAHHTVLVKVQQT
jgi:hypothetical protein